MQVLVQPFVSDDLGACFFKPFDISRVILMDVGDDGVLHRLRRDGFDLRDEVVVELIAKILCVDENHSLVGDANRGVAAGTGNHEEARLDLFDRLGLRLRSAGSTATLCALSALCAATIAATALAVTAATTLTATARRRLLALSCLREGCDRHGRQRDHDD